MIAHVFGTFVSSFILATDTNIEWPGVLPGCYYDCIEPLTGCFFLDDVFVLTVNQFYTKSVLTFSKLFCHSTPSHRNWPEAGF